MATGGLAGRTLLIGTALLIAHAAPAEATRPLVHASGAFDALRVSEPRDLGAALSGEVTGLRLEEPKMRARFVERAERFRSYRLAGRSGAAAFRRYCASPRERDNVYCVIEAGVLAERAAAAAAKARARLAAGSGDGRAVAAALRAADVTKLAAYGAAELSRGAGRFNDFEGLTAISRRIVSDPACALPLVANALASKAEEFLPDAGVMGLAGALYAKAARCGPEPHASQARFRQGLLAIWGKRPAEAEAAMRALVAAPQASAFHGRAKFWLYQLARRAGAEARAAEMRESLWRDHALSFQNLAVNGRDPRIRHLLVGTAAPKIAVRSLLRPDVNPFIRAIEALHEADAKGLAAEVAERSLARIGGAEPEVRLYVAVLMHRSGSALAKFRVLTALFQDAPRLISRSTLEMLFPKRYFDVVQPKARDIDPLLVLSLIRQESAFDSNAHSVAGARGLMQVMPATARHIASVRRDRLWDPRTNVEVGTKYLRHRLERYDGDVELTLAAYNAGFSRVDRWIKRYPLEDKLLFVDLIPFRETREYVSSILRNYFWYTQLYGAPADGGRAGASLTAGDKVSRILEANAGAGAVPASRRPSADEME